jgi:hypothetical protein
MQEMVLDLQSEDKNGAGVPLSLLELQTDG